MIKNTSEKRCFKNKGINEIFLGRTTYLTSVCEWRYTNDIRPWAL
jgi:hypothetical protein